MTIDKNIQYYRKKLGLSQEELGSKLFISRQTISQWETGQTVPTIENLIRLKEIFDVSIDELLGCSDDKSNESEQSEFANIEPKNYEDVSLEHYTCYLSKEEVAQLFKNNRTTLIHKLVIVTLIFVALLALVIINDFKSWAVGFVLGFIVLYSIIYIKAFKQNKRNKLVSMEKIPQCTYDYKIYSDCLTVSITRNNEITLYQKIYFKNIEQIIVVGEFIQLLVNGQIFVLKKSDISKSSILWGIIRNNPAKVQKNSSVDWLKISSIALFILTLFSIYIGIFLMTLTIDAPNDMPTNSWVFYLLTPIPISSIILGFILKAKGYKYLKNIIVGFIILPIMCVFGLFSFIFSAVYTENDNAIAFVESELCIDIPEYENIVAQDWTKSAQADSGRYIYYTTDVLFDEKTATEFFKQINADDRWLKSVPNELLGITSNIYDEAVYDYVLIYNLDTGEINTLPDENGTYYFVNLLYDPYRQQLKIVEYDLEFVKKESIITA